MPFLGKTPTVGNFILLDSITVSNTATFALTKDSLDYYPGSAQNMIVSVNGVTQAPLTAYTITDSNIIFASALDSDVDVIDYILVLGDTLNIGRPSDGTVGATQIQDYAVTSVKMSNTGVGAATYGTSTSIPQITVDAAGRITSATGIDRSNQFEDLTVTGNLTVSGNTVTVDAQTLSVEDPLIHLASNNETSDVVDIGFVGHYSNDGGTTKLHTGFFRDASDEQYYLFNGFEDATLDLSNPATTIDRTANTFTLAHLNVGGLNANGIFTIGDRGTATEELTIFHEDNVSYLISDSSAGGGAKGEFSFRTNDGGTAAERLRIDGDGNVHISTLNSILELGLSTNFSFNAGMSIKGSTPRLVMEPTGDAQSARIYFANTGGTGWGSIFAFNDTERIQVTANTVNFNTTRVGIGTSSPADELEIEGTDPAIRWDDTSAGGYARLEATNGSMVYESDQGNTVGNSTHIFKVDGTERVRIDSSGRLGIGTSPSYLVDARTSAGNAQIYLRSGGDLAQLLLISNDTTGTSQINFGDADANNIGLITYTHNQNAFRFTVNSAEAMRIASSGNVAIGNTNATYILDVDVGAPASSDRVLGRFSSQNGIRDIGFVWDDSASTLGVATLTNHSLTFHTGGNSNERMRIDTSGMVSITANNALTLGTGNGELKFGTWNNTSHTDIDGLLPGSTFGNLIEGAPNGHVVLALRDNDNADTFTIVSGGGDYATNNTYDTAIASFRAIGYVGIGTTLPAGPLHIQSATNRTIILDATFPTGSFTWQSVRRSGSEKFRWFINADDSMSIYSDAGSTFGMTWNTAGDAGITGSDTPTNVSSYRTLELGQSSGSKRGRVNFKTNNGDVTLYSAERSSYPYLGVYTTDGGTYIASFDRDGLKFGSDTAAANALDDYEEGTFTPSFAYSGGNGNGSWTFANATGRYTKIGNVCYYSIDLRFNSFSKGSASGQPQITNLPFTPANYADYNRVQCNITLYGYPYTTTDGYYYGGSPRQNGSTNTIDLALNVPNAASTYLNDPDSNSMIFCSGFYYTT